MATTKNGSLVLTLAATKNHDLDYMGGESTSSWAGLGGKGERRNEELIPNAFFFFFFF